jgi:hypothetical protein
VSSYFCFQHYVSVFFFSPELHILRPSPSLSRYVLLYYYYYLFCVAQYLLYADLFYIYLLFLIYVCIYISFSYFVSTDEDGSHCFKLDDSSLTLQKSPLDVTETYVVKILSVETGYNKVF